MRDYEQLCEVALREIDQLRERAHTISADQWPLPTRCTEWDVTSLTRHVASVIWQQAEAIHRTPLGIEQPPSYVEIRKDGASLLEAIEIARTSLAAGLEQLDHASEPTVPLPFAPLPATFAAAALVIEYGFHRNDLEWALGNPEPLNAEVAETHLELLPALLPMLGATPARPGIGYRLVADSQSLSIVWRDGAWLVTEDVGDRAVCELRGDDSTIALLSLGRIQTDHPAITVTDPDGMAPSFGELFGGL